MAPKKIRFYWPDIGALKINLRGNRGVVMKYFPSTTAIRRALKEATMSQQADSKGADNKLPAGDDRGPHRSV